MFKSHQVVYEKDAFATKQFPNSFSSLALCLSETRSWTSFVAITTSYQVHPVGILNQIQYTNLK